MTVNTKKAQTLLVLDPYDRPAKHTVASQTMGIARVPLESIKSNMESVLGDCAEIFKNVSATLGNCRMEYVDVSLGLAVDGSVGVLGSKLGAEADSCAPRVQGRERSLVKHIIPRRLAARESRASNNRSPCE